uniref:Putative thiol-disulfide isomerase and thioredoxin n=1 Tax=Corethrella appendiculata TaxID=1370023 RepID=U5ETG4_9DIPT
MMRFLSLILSFFVVNSLLINFVYTAESQVIELDEDNWDLMLTNEWLVEFYAPWCPACKNLQPIFDDLSSWSDDLNIKTGKVDVTTSPGLSGRFFVTALPTIFHVYNGEFRQYKGSRDLNSFMTFIEEKKWQSIETVSAWKRPDSIQMSVVSLFFKLSYHLKEFNNMLLKEYELPIWASYGLFGIGTLLLGTLLGLILVCIIDCLCPPKPGQRQSFAEQRDKPKKDEEIHGDELEDEDECQQPLIAEAAGDGNGETAETSDGEKYSGSDSDDDAANENKSAPPSPKKESNSTKVTPHSSPNVRKRKSKKV